MTLWRRSWNVVRMTWRNLSRYAAELYDSLCWFNAWKKSYLVDLSLFRRVGQTSFGVRCLSFIHLSNNWSLGLSFVVTLENEAFKPKWISNAFQSRLVGCGSFRLAMAFCHFSLICPTKFISKLKIIVTFVCIDWLSELMSMSFDPRIHL